MTGRQLTPQSLPVSLPWPQRPFCYALACIVIRSITVSHSQEPSGVSQAVRITSTAAPLYQLSLESADSSLIPSSFSESANPVLLSDGEKGVVATCCFHGGQNETGFLQWRNASSGKEIPAGKITDGYVVLYFHEPRTHTHVSRYETLPGYVPERPFPKRL